MPSAVADTQLLSLLQRAAEELKDAQRDTAQARAELEAMRLRAERAEAELTRLQAGAEVLTGELERLGPGLLTPPVGALTGVLEGLGPGLLTPPVGALTGPLVGADSTVVLVGDGATRVGSPELGLLQARLKATEAELGRELELRRALKERLATAEEAVAELGSARSRVAELEGQLAELRQVAVTPEAELQQQLAQARAEAAAQRERVGQLEASLARLEAAASATGAPHAAAARVSQLEADLLAVRTRRDELNVELGQLETERKVLKGRVAELEAGASRLEAAAAEQRAAAEASLDEERTRHLSTAEGLAEAQATVAELEADRQRLRESLDTLEARQASATGALEQQLQAMAAQLQHARAEWQHVERQYEQLHKEMLLVLDQRDEARREVQSLRRGPG